MEIIIQIKDDKNITAKAIVEDIKKPTTESEKVLYTRKQAAIQHTICNIISETMDKKYLPKKSKLIIPNFKK